MEQNDNVTLEQACEDFGVLAPDVLNLLRALSELHPNDAGKVLKVATGIAIALNAREVKE